MRPYLPLRFRISIHALREEGDVQLAEPASPGMISIHALREEGDAPPPGYQQPPYQFLSTPSARRATHPSPNFRPNNIISIHALREEGDCAAAWPRSRLTHFYPRPPRGGRRAGYVVIGDTLVFLSTPSARRATPGNGFGRSGRDYFYPRPPRGGRLEVDKTDISLYKFLSTPSARRATISAMQRHTS